MGSPAARFWDVAGGNVKERIFRHLNFTDLKICRFVCKSWNTVVVSSSPFKSSVLYVSLGPNSQNILETTKVHWNHIRFELFDASTCPELLWKQLQSTASAFSYIQILEFKQCFISWQLFKKLITLTSSSLRDLTFQRSIFKDAEHLPPQASQCPTLRLNHREHEQFLRRISNIQALSVSEVGELTGIVEILEKMILYSASTLITLKIEYKTSQCLRPTDIVRFLQVLSELIVGNKVTLKNLILNIWNHEILEDFLPFVLAPMESCSPHLNLRVFKLAQPIPDNANVTINVNSSRFLLHLAEFLRTQRQLQTLAFPNLIGFGVFETRRWSVLDSTTKHLKELHVPGAMYLRRNTFKSFQCLKTLFIGEKFLGKNSGTFLHPTKFNLDRAGIAKKNMTKIHSLSVYAPIVYESGNMFHVLEKLPNLTTFEFNGLRPVFNDKDVQAVIKYLPKLRHLTIVHCDLITDVGVTGIPLKICEDMIRYGTLYLDDIKGRKKLGKAGSAPLSDLRSLLSLELVGNSQITDVGIKFGLEFQDLRKIQLPFCEKVTSWGIEQLGLQNVCLESLILTGATAETAIGLTKVTAVHNRLVKDQCKVQTIRKTERNLILPTLLHAILWTNGN